MRIERSGVPSRGARVPLGLTASVSAELARSSSGFRDGLGSRSLVFDRAHGRALDALRVRPDLAALHPLIKGRAANVETFRHRCFPRVRRLAVEPGQLTVYADHIPGTRLSETLDLAELEGVRPDVSAIVYLVGRILRGLVALHEATGTAHGAIAAERLVVTPRGSPVLVEHVFGSAIQRLQFSRERLWREMRVAMPLARKRVAMDGRSDVAQVGFVALALLLGRPLTGGEYPDRIEPLLSHGLPEHLAGLGVGESAMHAIRRWLERAVSAGAERPFGSAPEALQSFDRHVVDQAKLSATRGALGRFVETALDTMPAGAELDTGDATVVTEPIPEPPPPPPPPPVPWPEARPALPAAAPAPTGWRRGWQALLALLTATSAVGRRLGLTLRTVAGRAPSERRRVSP